MTTYSIDTGDGNQLTAGLQGYDHARRVAQQRANDLGETVYLHEPGTRWQLTDTRTGDDAGEYEAETAEDAIAACVAEHDVPGADTAPSANDLSAVEVAPEAIEPETVRCACGEWSGHRCSWVGDRSETVIVEFMPEQYRSSHAAAGNRGLYPASGARRIRVERSCADSMIEQDGEWCEIRS